MEYGICKIPFLPVREEPSETSEMATCLLFGETFAIHKSDANWHYIEMDYDSYKGWLFSRNLSAFFINSQDVTKEYDNYLVGEPFQTINSKQTQLYLSLGTPLPFFDGISCYVGQERFQVEGYPYTVSAAISNSLKIAEKFMGTPYLWGGRSSFGVDCSGFTQILLRYAKIHLPRDAKDQVQTGEVINSLSKSDLGDLAFFENEKGKITHTGIIYNTGEIIHASEQVKKDSLDEKGIWNKTLNQYTHSISAIRRYH